jgi:hypothetical protein
MQLPYVFKKKNIFIKKKKAATMHSLVELNINIRGHEHSTSGRIGGVTMFKHGLTIKLREHANLREQQVTHY